MLTNLLYRKLEPHELQECINLELPLYPAHQNWKVDMYHEFVKNPQMAFFVCEDVTIKKIIGCAFALVGQGKRNDETWFQSNTVHPDYRRQGIASHFIELRLQVGVRNRDRVVYVEMGVNNVSSIIMHLKMGFVPYLISDTYYDGVEDALCMRKYINEQKAFNS